MTMTRRKALFIQRSPLSPLCPKKKFLTREIKLPSADLVISFGFFG